MKHRIIFLVLIRQLERLSRSVHCILYDIDLQFHILVDLPLPLPAVLRGRVGQVGQGHRQLQLGRLLSKVSC